jgi:hypothetical protein
MSSLIDSFLVPVVDFFHYFAKDYIWQKYPTIQCWIILCRLSKRCDILLRICLGVAKEKDICMGEGQRNLLDLKRKGNMSSS